MTTKTIDRAALANTLDRLATRFDEIAQNPDRHAVRLGGRMTDAGTVMAAAVEGGILDDTVLPGIEAAAEYHAGDTPALECRHAVLAAHPMNLWLEVVRCYQRRGEDPDLVGLTTIEHAHQEAAEFPPQRDELGRLVPHPDLHGHTAVSNSRVCGAACRWLAEKVVAPPSAAPLTDAEQAVWDEIQSLEPGGAIPAKELAKRTGHDIGTITGRIIPRLKKVRGVENRRGVGYYVAQQ